ncbi:MAG: oligosaccharide flippase family protein [Chitinophagaceae bacterium]|nr:oligosaccharide flippase family protein [Chitinophagaceae bacterium]HMN31989.1 oligosaccharide flippase family protein [Chitinophagaceae bacterium]
MSQKATNVIILTIAQGVNIVLGFLFTPYLVRTLDKNIYGTFSQVNLVADVVSLVFSIAIIQIAMMLFSNTNKRFEDSIKTVILFVLYGGILGAIFCIIFSFFAPSIFKNELLGMWLKLFSFSIIGSKLNLVLNQALIRINKTKFLMTLSVCSNFTKLSLALVALKVFQSVEMLLIVYALEPIISSIIQIALLKKLNLLTGRFDRMILKEIWQIGIPLYIVELLGNSYTYIAGFIISGYFGENEYAIYKNGSMELPLIGTIYATISTIMMADMTMHIQSKNYLAVAESKRKIITTTAVVIFPLALFFIFFNKEFITIYFSEKYIESSKIFIVFCLALLIRIQNYSDILIILRKSKYVLYSFLVFMIMNIILNIFLSKTLGILGCAIATISSVYILSFMQLHLTIKSLKVTYNQYIDFKSLFKILVITLVAICIIRMGLDLITLPAIPMFLLGGILTLPLLYFYFIKSKFIDIQLYENLFNKIPIFGKHLYKILQ